ncbi:uncharacterized protein IL334_000756 [Kwoniella shivajii]|uniref:Rab-GAP TBC domain-containing protein n=1 Tax=Kwoniella shivajii TaxID=564305 RepID=A0ABZ1CT26_9TREE|nr:hypothetical protein IL334_000756 [Kwoniella shivajii]
MPFQPPTRPHSANPGMNPSIFPRTVSSSSVYKHIPSHQQQQHQQNSNQHQHQHQHQIQQHKSSSMTSFGKTSTTEDWEDAWDSSSDKEDDIKATNTNITVNTNTSEPMEISKSVPIPVKIANNNNNYSQYRNGNTNGNGEFSFTPGSGSGSDIISGSGDKEVSASWNSTSYHHVSPPSPIVRPSLLQAKTYTEGAIPPAPGTSIPDSYGGKSNGTGSKLPPGGAWEIVEPSEIREDIQQGDLPIPEKVGKEAVKDDVEDILIDPLKLLSNLSLDAPQTPNSTDPSSSFPFLTPTSSYPQTPSTANSASPDASTSYTILPSTPRTLTRKEGLGRQRSVRTERKREKFGRVLRGRDGGGVELGELRKLAWNGIPEEVRGVVWMLLLNYLPLPVQPRLTTLNRKRKEYTQLVDQYFGRGLASLDQQIWHQIEIDVPRTRPGVALWACVKTQRSLERILYVWAIRHPASGYVQGINDLVTPFFQVFLGAYIDTDPELFDIAHLPENVLQAIEADTFWCLTKLLDGIQDHYISQQPGIQRLVKRMGDLVKRIDAPLAAHFEEQGVEFMQFAFRWMNCLLMREISVKCTIRMWDTYLAEGADAFSQFHLYVCSALLVKYSERLREMDFQEMIMFLQCLPTQLWTDHEIELLLSEAYVLKMVWAGAENHFANLPNGNQGQFGMLGR